MLRFAVLSFAVFVCSLAGRAQEATSPSREAPKASYAYARGENTYLLYSDEGYRKDKKYVVFQFYKADEPLTTEEKTALTALTSQLAKKGIELKAVEWKSEQDLTNALKDYGIQVESRDGKSIRLKGDNYSMNTTATKVTLVLEEGRPLSLCSGTGCEERLERFFGINVRI